MATTAAHPAKTAINQSSRTMPAGVAVVVAVVAGVVLGADVVPGLVTGATVVPAGLTVVVTGDGKLYPTVA